MQKFLTVPNHIFEVTPFRKREEETFECLFSLQEFGLLTMKTGCSTQNYNLFL